MNTHAADFFSASKIIKPEYVIYSFEKDQVSKGSPVWSRAMSLTDEDEAFRQAQVLFGTRKFTRIEVRSKIVDSETGMVAYKPIKVLDVSPQRMRRLCWLLVSALGCAIAAGLIVLAGS